MNRLFREIEQLKSELNTKVIQDSGGINAEETLKISKKLDELIVKYIKDKK
ncbi:MAG: aspartyl-phosphate phosphatase Spo0E family protein [Clostridiales bacterium]|nr:aspartyl-phosphate phosphatase Spo0E family protein [Clostridiales bacterium]